MDQKGFYTELGKLLYAIAASDGNIRLKESKNFREILDKEFITARLRNNESGIENAHYAELEMEWLQEHKINPKVAFASFVRFIKQNSESIDISLKKSIMNAAKDVANAFHQTNRYEKHYLSRLEESL